MNNINPLELIPQRPHVTLWGLCTLIYRLWHLLCILWIVRISNLRKLSEVRISNFEYVCRVMRSEKLVRKLKVCIWRSIYVNQGLTVLLSNQRTPLLHHDLNFLFRMILDCHPHQMLKLKSLLK